MESTSLTSQQQGLALEKVLLQGDLKDLSAEQRVGYVQRVCDSLGLNPLTKPFEYIVLNGKLTLYAKRDAADQLRRVHTVSVKIMSREMVGDIYVVTAQASLPNGRTDESIGAVNLMGLKGDALANCFMKAETKAKRRVTLSICGLGLLDETEVETIEATKPKLAPNSAEIDPIPVTAEQRKRLLSISTEAGWAPSDVTEAINGLGVESSRELNAVTYAKLVDTILRNPKKHVGADDPEPLCDTCGKSYVQCVCGT